MDGILDGSGAGPIVPADGLVSVESTLSSTETPPPADDQLIGGIFWPDYSAINRTVAVPENVKLGTLNILIFMI